MNIALLVVTLLAAPAPSPHRPGATPATRAQPAPHRQGVPPLRWERIIKKCGAPCLVWARHILDAATSPGGFRWQIRALAQTARRAYRAGRLKPHHARKLRFAIGRLARALKRMTADGLLTHRERRILLRGIIKTGHALHRATRARVYPRRWRPTRPPVRRLPTTPPPPPPAPRR